MKRNTILLGKMIMGGLFEEVKSEHRCKLVERIRNVNFVKGSVPGRGNTRAKVLSGKKMFKEQRRGQCEWSRFIKGDIRKGWINTQKPDPMF